MRRVEWLKKLLSVVDSSDDSNSDSQQKRQRWRGQRRREAVQSGAQTAAPRGSSTRDGTGMEWSHISHCRRSG